jgi:hypothetical protein
VWFGRAAGLGLFTLARGVVVQGDVIFFEIHFYVIVLKMW